MGGWEGAGLGASVRGDILKLPNMRATPVDGLERAAPCARTPADFQFQQTNLVSVPNPHPHPLPHPQTSFHRPNLVFRVVPKVERGAGGADDEEAPCMAGLIRRGLDAIPLPSGARVAPCLRWLPSYSVFTLARKLTRTQANNQTNKQTKKQAS